MILLFVARPALRDVVDGFSTCLTDEDDGAAADRAGRGPLIG
jgi:hypothetical protein